MFGRKKKKPVYRADTQSVRLEIKKLLYHGECKNKYFDSLQKTILRAANQDVRIAHYLAYNLFDIRSQGLYDEGLNKYKPIELFAVENDLTIEEALEQVKQDKNILRKKIEEKYQYLITKDEISYDYSTIENDFEKATNDANTLKESISKNYRHNQRKERHHLEKAINLKEPNILFEVGKEYYQGMFQIYQHDAYNLSKIDKLKYGYMMVLESANLGNYEALHYLALDSVGLNEDLDYDWSAPRNKDKGIKVLIALANNGHNESQLVLGGFAEDIGTLEAFYWGTIGILNYDSLSDKIWKFRNKFPKQDSYYHELRQFNFTVDWCNRLYDELTDEQIKDVYSRIEMWSPKNNKLSWDD